MIYQWIFLVVSWHLCNADNLALLSGTLRTYQQAACDDDVVTLKCPPGTSISVELAQYGKYSFSKPLCPAGARHAAPDDGHTCLWPSALQYSLLQTVVEACQKKSICQVQASPATFDGDPCPGERKYVEVAYKCRPYEFRSRVACENDRIHLECNANSRVAIYSASYGRTEYESSQCPQPQGVAEETCLVSYATETVMQICHGKRQCEISADVSTFGNPCQPQTRMYLRIVYTCVPRKVLSKQYEGQLESDEVETDLDMYNRDDFAHSESSNGRSSSTIPNASNVGKADREGFINMTKGHRTLDTKHSISSTRLKHIPKNLTDQVTIERVDTRTKGIATINSSSIYGHPTSDNTISVTPAERDQVIGFISAWIHTYSYVSKNQERFYIYVLASIAAAIILCTAIFASRLLIRRRRAKRAAQGHPADLGDGSVAHGFVDDISEVDADIDLTPASDLVLHTHYGGPLASFAVEPPRAVSHPAAAAAASVYYYG